MFRSKSILWITFAFCVSTGSCKDIVIKSGGDVKMDCANMDLNSEIEWKLNNTHLLLQTKTGSIRKGTSEVANRARIERTSLKISSLKRSDAGTYTCGSSLHRLYIASAHVNPSSVLHSGEAKLSCDTGGFKGIIQWDPPHSKPSISDKEVTLKSVTSDNAGCWTCVIKNTQKENILELKVDVTFVGPLKTSEEVTISEGGTAELPCFLPAPSNLPIKGGSWARDPPSDILLPALMATQGGVQWNSTNVNTNKVTFTGEKLITYFNVTLRKVKHADAGVYVCSLDFGDGKSLSAKLKLTVTKRDGSASDSEGSKVKKYSMWHNQVWGMQLWIWIVMATSALVLIGLVVIILLIYRRNKRMKMKMKRLKSVQRRPLTSMNYCKCDRTVRTVTQPGTGKRERPPPLPRHQYSSLSQ